MMPPQGDLRYIVPRRAGLQLSRRTQTEQTGNGLTFGLLKPLMLHHLLLAAVAFSQYRALRLVEAADCGVSDKSEQTA